MTDYIERLEILAKAATDCNLDTAEKIALGDGEIECPVCCGEGYVAEGNDYLNIDDLPLGVQFYGMGNEPIANEDLFREITPKKVLSLIERLRTAEQERDLYKAQRDELLADLQRLVELASLGAAPLHKYTAALLQSQELIKRVRQPPRVVFGQDNFVPVELLLKPDLTEEDINEWKRQNGKPVDDDVWSDNPSEYPES